MLTTLEPTHVTDSVDETIAADTATRTTRRPSACEVLIALHGFALAVLVGGTTLGEIVRSLAMSATTAGMLIVVRRPRSVGAETALTAFGLAGLMAGIGVGIPHTVVSPGSPISVSGVALVLTGLAVITVGTRQLLRRLRRWWKLLALPISVLTFVAIVFPVTLSMFVTNVPDFPLGDDTPADFGLAYEDVTVTTADGVDLAAWYVPSTNGSAIVQLGGCCAARDDELEYTAVLARHGFGVLVLDQRGHGGSEGDGMLWGWWGEIDVVAGVDYLAGRPDVVDQRIGAIGMSVGGEQAIAAAGVDARIRAVVVEGVSARGARDEGTPANGAGGLLIRYFEVVTRNAAALMTSAPEPTQMRDAVDAMQPHQRVLIANAAAVPTEVAAAEALAAVDSTIVSTWMVPDTGHIQALAVHPEEWERRVIGFFDRSL